MGSGSWGTAFAMILADAGCDVTMWSRRPELAATICREHRNPDYLPDLELPPSVQATPDAARALEGAGVVVLAVPSQHLRENLSGWSRLVPARRTGGVADEGRRAGHHPADEPGDPTRPGTSRPTASSSCPAPTWPPRSPSVSRPRASSPASTTTRPSWWRTRARRPTFRPYTATTSSASSWVARSRTSSPWRSAWRRAWGCGDNTKATIVTRGLAETARLGAALGADPATFAGLAGVGDLIATCLSPLSRNRTFGENLGRGLSVDEVIAATRQTAEGVKSCQSILDLATPTASTCPSPRASSRSCTTGCRRARWGGGCCLGRRKAEGD